MVHRTTEVSKAVGDHEVTDMQHAIVTRSLLERSLADRNTGRFAFHQGHRRSTIAEHDDISPLGKAVERQRRFHPQQ